MIESIFLIGIALLVVLAFANGSNDVSKGIATLVGSGVADYNRAILWGTVWTTVGGLLAILFSMTMVQTFANGILSSTATTATRSSALPFAVMAGAISWVMFASRTGLPVSTTHAITGALCGAGVAAVGWEGIQWSSLVHKVVLPLALSPLLAMGIAFVILPAVRWALSGWKGHCICLIPAQKVHLMVEQSGLIRMVPDEVGLVTVVNTAHCEMPKVLGIRVGPDTFHWITSGLTSMARGLNDAPKIVALFVGLSLLYGGQSSALSMLAFGAVALGMGLGSYLGGHKVTEVLAERVTRMDHLEGFSANLTTAFLVIIAARLGLPVSTTHVSSSAIIGMGLRKGSGEINWKTVSEMVLAWLLTLPVAALLSAASYLLMSVL